MSDNASWPAVRAIPTIRASVLCILPVVAALSIEPVHAQAEPRAQVMILGTYHMANPGADYVNPEVDDVLAAPRQAEIVAVVQALAEFRPTRIAIEAPPSRDSLHYARYRAYRAGEYVLRRDEIDQIGYRLARMMGPSACIPWTTVWTWRSAASCSSPRRTGRASWRSG